MNDIRSIVKTAARRLNVASLLERLHLVAVVAAAAALALMIANRVPEQPFVPWVWVGPILGGLAAAVALGLWFRRRPREMQVAMQIDERLDLREKLSIALHCSHREDPFARAAVEDAVQVARSPQTRERVRRQFAVCAPRGWWISPVLVLLVLLTSTLSQFGMFSEDEVQKEDLAQASMLAQNSMDAVIKQIKQDPELESKLSDELKDLLAEPIGGEKLQDPEEIRRDAIKKVSELSKKLEEIVNSPDGQASKMLDKALQKLNSGAEDTEAKEIADAVKNGDFDAAQKALKNMMDKFAKGELNEAELQNAAEALEDIAKQLEELAKNQDALKDALKNAGLDPNLANNPQAMQQAINNNQNLNQQQKQQLQQMAQAQQQCQGACQGLGQGLGQLAQAMQQGQQGQGQMGQAAGQMQQMLNNLEGMQQMLRQAQAAQNACQGQCQGLGQGLGNLGQPQLWQVAQQQPGGAFGNRGQGAGGQAPKSKTPSGTKIENDPGKTDNSGPVIFRQFVEGEQVVGQSNAKLQAVLANIVQGNEEGLSEDQLPRKYHETHKSYFGQLGKRVESGAPSAQPPVPQGETKSGSAGN